MVEKQKKQKRVLISEEDISTVLQRYTATTVLALLQEVAQVRDVKIDWNALVKKTTTGISSAREYQMLWRHLAYRDTLLERLDDEAQPLDDDSDLEYELEAFPPVNSEASTEAAACVKVLIASGLPSESSLPNGLTVEAPLTINIPNSQSTRGPSENSQFASLMQGTNITVPVCVKKQPLPTVTSAEGLDANGSVSGSLPARRKRKPWSAAEDMELIAAVQKCGEGNWANILKGDFKGDRTASQLSQRWAIIRKRKGNLNVGSGSQLSEVQLAARRAMSLALNMPIVDKLKAASSIAGTNSNITPSNSAHPSAAEASSLGPQSQHLSLQDSIATVAQQSGTSSGSLSKSRVISKNPLTKSALSPDELVKAAAVAAGARIATPSDAASLLKAAQAKNAVHIMPGGGGSLIKSSVAGNATTPLPSPHLGPHPNVHYIRTGFSTHSSVLPNSSRPSTSILVNKLEVKTVEDIVICSSVNSPKDFVQKDQAAVSGNAQKEQVQEGQVAFAGNAPKEQVQEDQDFVTGNAREPVQEDQGSVMGDDSNKQVQEDQMDFIANSKCSSGETEGNDQTVGIGNQAAGECKNTNDDNMTPVKGRDDNQAADMEICENQNVNGKQEDFLSMAVDGSNATAGTETGDDEKRVVGLE